MGHPGRAPDVEVYHKVGNCLLLIMCYFFFYSTKSRKEEKELWCGLLNKSKWGTNKKVLHGHFYFSNIEALDCPPGTEMPVWINMVRDPVDRQHSSYIFVV